VALLALHGILHAIGLDHQTSQQQRRIGEIQSQVLMRAGIPYREFKWDH
jgi:ssRNA-specific RNase YbeY (16S rRNA maturation enzyme)